MTPDPDAPAAPPEAAPAAVPAPAALNAAEYRAVEAAIAGAAGLLFGRVLLGRAGGLAAGLAALGVGLLGKRLAPPAKTESAEPGTNGGKDETPGTNGTNGETAHTAAPVLMDPLMMRVRLQTSPVPPLNAAAALAAAETVQAGDFTLVAEEEEPPETETAVAPVPESARAAEETGVIILESRGEPVAERVLIPPWEEELERHWEPEPEPQAQWEPESVREATAPVPLPAAEEEVEDAGAFAEIPALFGTVAEAVPTPVAVEFPAVVPSPPVAVEPPAVAVRLPVVEEPPSAAVPLPVAAELPPAEPPPVRVESPPVVSPLPVIAPLPLAALLEQAESELTAMPAPATAPVARTAPVAVALPATIAAAAAAAAPSSRTSPVVGLLEDLPVEFAELKEEQEPGPRDFLILPEETPKGMPELEPVVAALSVPLTPAPALEEPPAPTLEEPLTPALDELNKYDVAEDGVDDEVEVPETLLGPTVVPIRPIAAPLRPSAGPVRPVTAPVRPITAPVSPAAEPVFSGMTPIRQATAPVPLAVPITAPVGEASLAGEPRVESAAVPVVEAVAPVVVAEKSPTAPAPVSETTGIPEADLPPWAAPVFVRETVVEEELPPFPIALPDLTLLTPASAPAAAPAAVEKTGPVAVVPPPLFEIPSPASGPGPSPLTAAPVPAATAPVPAMAVPIPPLTPLLPVPEAGVATPPVPAVPATAPQPILLPRVPTAPVGPPTPLPPAENSPFLVHPVSDIVVAPPEATAPILLPELAKLPSRPGENPDDIWRQAAAELSNFRTSPPPAPPLPFPEPVAAPSGPSPFLGPAATPPPPPGTGSTPVPLPLPFPDEAVPAPPTAATPVPGILPGEVPPWLKQTGETTPVREAGHHRPAEARSFLPTIRLAVPQGPQPLSARRPLPDAAPPHLETSTVMSPVSLSGYFAADLSEKTGPVTESPVVPPVDVEPAPPVPVPPVTPPPVTPPPATPPPQMAPPALPEPPAAAVPAIPAAAAMPAMPVPATVPPVPAIATPVPAALSLEDKLRRPAARNAVPSKPGSQVITVRFVALLALLAAAALGWTFKGSIHRLWEERIQGKTPPRKTSPAAGSVQPKPSGTPGDGSDVIIAPDPPKPATNATPASPSPGVPAAPASPGAEAPSEAPPPPDSEPLPPAPPAAEPDNSRVVIPQTEAGAREVINRLLHATAARQVMPHILDSTKLEPAVNAYFTAGKPVPVATHVCELERSDKIPGTNHTLWMFKVTTDTIPGGFPAVVEQTEDGLRANWELLRQCRDMELQKWAANTKASPGLFYTALQRRHPFPDMLPGKDHTQFLAFAIASPNLGEQATYVFIPKTAPLAARADGLYNFGGSTQAPLLELTHKDGHAEITGIVLENWRSLAKR